MATIFLCLALLMSTGCMADRLATLPQDSTRKPLYTFNTDADFNITSKLGFSAPKCSRLCYPFPGDIFADKKIPCVEHEGDEREWVSCLCTHRPFIRYLVDCIFRKCGPAIPSAFEFGYQICADYNITFPPPPEAVVDLNITVLNDAITIPDTIPKMPFPFSEELPPAEDGGSTSDENPPLNLNASMQSTAWQGKSMFLAESRELGSRRRLTTALLWITMIIGLGGGFGGL